MGAAIRKVKSSNNKQIDSQQQDNQQEQQGKEVLQTIFEVKGQETTESNNSKKEVMGNVQDEWSLKPHSTIKKPKNTLLVVVIDGFGEDGFEDEYDASFQAKTPFIDSLRQAGPDRYVKVNAHGTYVGLPSDADMGNSEVGHNALGAGQIYDQGASLVDKALEGKYIFEGEGWKYIEPSFESGTLHLIGLLSDGGVHSRYDQLLQLMEGAVERGVKRIRVHTLLDGRDCEDGSSVKLMKALTEDAKKLSANGSDVRVASGGGRMAVTMDRYESDWDIVKKGYYAHVLGEAPHKFTCANQAIETLRGDPKKPVSDQYLDAFVITDDNQTPIGEVKDGDAVVVFNFRADRVVEISKALEYENFDKFDRQRHPQIRFAGMMQYDGELKLPKKFLVNPPLIKNTSGEYLAKNGVSLFACSESQKIGHVTFFWNGNRSGYFDEKLETYHEVPSDKIPFNQKPEMKTKEITDEAIKAIESKKYDVVRINYPSPDMVGHTGDLEATITAVTFVDENLKRLLECVNNNEGIYIVTADHGNAEDLAQRQKKTNEPLKDKEGKVIPLTAHTLNPVAVWMGGTGLAPDIKFKHNPEKVGLANVTATYMNLLGFEAPNFYKPSLLA